LELGHDACANHLPKPRHTALASSAECFRFNPKPESVKASGTAPQNLPVTRNRAAVPGERIVSVSLVEDRVAIAKQWQARMWPKDLRQALVLCAALAACDAHASRNRAEGLTVRTERDAARPVRPTVKQLSCERQPRAKTDAARRLPRLTSFLGGSVCKRRDAVRLARM
jgi:hypothetical protein